MRAFVLAAITAYQRHLSPHKGFCCAYRVHTGRHGCSMLGFRAIRRYGVLAGIGVLRGRLHLCGVAHRRYHALPKRPHRAQRGDCDPGCDMPCDVNCDGAMRNAGSGLGNFAGCCDGASCGGSDRNRKGDAQEQYVYIPPYADAGRQRGR